MLCYRVGRVGGNSENVKLAVGILHIHVVKSRATKSENRYAKLTEAVDNRRTYRVVDENADSVKSARKLCGVLVELRLEKFEADAMLLAIFFKGRLVVGLGIKKSDP